MVGSDQPNAMKFLRRQLNRALIPTGARLQHQGFDQVLRNDDRNQSAFEKIVAYIAANPQRAHLIDRACDYPYTISMVPGYPDLDFFQHDFWNRLWRAHAYLLENGLFRLAETSS